jgi:hypothetical protein
MSFIIVHERLGLFGKQTSRVGHDLRLLALRESKDRERERENEGEFEGERRSMTRQCLI